MTQGHWLGIFGLILLAWGLVYAMSASYELRALGAFYGADFWAAFCTITPDGAGFLKLVAMWAIMSAAMMAPTFLPALATYDELPTSNAAGLGQLLAGYMIVWLGFSLVAGLVQLALFRSGVLSPFGQSISLPLSAALLIIAGMYQFSTFKEACLAKCRMPLTFFMERWRDSPWNALDMGLRLGALCLGCCWALMALAFVGGTMNILWMGLATLLMILEKLPDIGRYVTRPLGYVLIAAGFGVLGATAF